MYRSILALSLLSLVLSPGCRKQQPDELLVPDNLEEVVIPDGFEFKTSREINLTIYDNFDEGLVRYDVYNFESDIPNGKICSGRPHNGSFDYTFSVPKSSTQLYLVRNRLGVFETTFIDLGVTDNVIFTYDGVNMRGAGGGDRADCSELLYAVNGDGEFYTIDNESGLYDATQLTDLVGGGSIACAVDRGNRLCYYNTGTTLRYYDIDNETFHEAQQGNPFNSQYPRMEYNNTNGLLYIAKGTNMHVIDPLTNATISSYSIVGLEAPTGGGDVAISLDGTIYMCCFSGLYHIELNGNSANASRISAENLPFQPTSMAIDRNDVLYLATNGSNSQLIEMDKFDGAWTVRNTYDHRINDLGSLPCTLEELSDQDTDEDGVPDVQDDFPDDGDLAFESYTPSELGWGSLAFEDLWPYQGDYDFNDLVLNYRINEMSNSSNEVVKIQCHFRIKNIGGSLTNGFGFEMPLVSPGEIESVTGYNLTENMITLNANGTETGQSNAVIIVFDNAFQNGNWGNCVAQPEDDITIEITFTTPLQPGEVGTAPFNPFIFINQRSKEVHLANYQPTDLGSTSEFGTGDDASGNSSGNFYRSSNGLPWAINIVHHFRHPLEGQAINDGYNKFITWGSTGGSSFSDWYKDNSGYRNAENLCVQD